MKNNEIMINRLSYEITEDNSIILRFDGKPFNEYFGISNVGIFLSPYELINSLDNPGRYFIYSCDCGDPGCAGWFKGIGVDITGDHYTWQIEEKIPVPTKLIFPKKQYTDLIVSLSNELKPRG